MASEDYIGEIIDNAVDIAYNKEQKVDIWCNAAWNKYDIPSPPTAIDSAAGINDIAFPTALTVPAVAGADGIIETIKELNSSLFIDSADQVVQKVTSMLAGYISVYFPSFQSEMGVDELRSVLATRGHRLTPVYEQQAFARAKGRVIGEQMRLEAQARSEFASRGYPVPPGALMAQLNAVRAESLGKVVEVGTDIALKQEELAAQTYIAVLGQALQYRTQAANASGQYLQTLITSIMRQSGAESYASILAARNQLLSATSSMYNTISSAAEAKARLKFEQEKLKRDNWQVEVQGDIALTTDRSHVSVQAANAMAQVAAAALSSVNSVASLASVTNQ